MHDGPPSDGPEALEDYARLAQAVTGARGVRVEAAETIEVGTSDGETWTVDLPGIGSMVLFGGSRNDTVALVARRLTAALKNEHAHRIALGLTERANDIARSAARRFETLFEGLPVACYACDTDGLLREWNRAAEEMWGPAIAAGWGTPVAPIVDPDRPEAEWSILDRALKGETVRLEEREVRIGSGETRCHLASAFPLREGDGRIVGAIAIRLDITRRRAAEREMASREARFREVLETLPDGVTVLDEHGNLVLHNRAAAESLHMAVEAGTDLGSVFPPLVVMDAEGHPLSVGDWPIFVALREGTPTRAARLRFEYSDGGEPIWASVSATPLRDPEGGAPLGAVATFRDVTDLVDCEARMAELERKGDGG